MVHVAGEDDDRGRWRATLAAGNGVDDAHEPRKGFFERSPVFEIEALPDPLAEGPDHASPRAGADRFVPSLNMVQGRRKQQRHRGHQHQVVKAPAHAALEPLPFLLVEHRPPPSLQDAPSPRVDDHEPARAKGSGVAPSAAVRLMTGVQRKRS